MIHIRKGSHSDVRRTRRNLRQLCQLVYIGCALTILTLCFESNMRLYVHIITILIISDSDHHELYNLSYDEL